MIYLPPDVIAWIKTIFERCNASVTHQLSLVPFSHEPALDQLLISEIQKAATPVVLPSDWTVLIDTHFLGGRALFRNWEVADIGILVIFRDRGRIVRSKVALLQSKRLYAREQKSADNLLPEYRLGFGRLIGSDEEYEKFIKTRIFHFDDQSAYHAMKKEDNQWKAIEGYQSTRKIPVYYLFYNPVVLPWTLALPAEPRNLKAGEIKVGARVVGAKQVMEACKSIPKNGSPTYGLLANGLSDPFKGAENRAGWKLEHFVADLLMQCHVGYVAAPKNDEELFSVFFHRSGPISAAIAVTIDSPSGFDFTDRQLPEA